MESADAAPNAPVRIHRVFERLTAIKARVYALRQRLRRGTLDPAEVEAHLADIDLQVDSAARELEGLRGERLAGAIPEGTHGAATGAGRGRRPHPL